MRRRSHRARTLVTLQVSHQAAPCAAESGPPARLPRPLKLFPSTRPAWDSGLPGVGLPFDDKAAPLVNVGSLAASAIRTSRFLYLACCSRRHA